MKLDLIERKTRKEEIETQIVLLVVVFMTTWK